MPFQSFLLLVWTAFLGFYFPPCKTMHASDGNVQAKVAKGLPTASLLSTKL